MRLLDLWSYRELIYFLAWRDVKIIYKQSILGVAWVVIPTLVTALLFSVLFGNLARLPSGGLPYPVFAYAALLPWNLFAGAVTRSTDSLVGSANLIKKVYFPRLVIPISSALGVVVDFAISLVVLFALAAYFGFGPHLTVLLLPVFALLALAAGLAFGLWFSALNAQYRDIRYVVPVLVQLGLYASPVTYSVELIPEQWRPLYSLNPMVGIIEGFRWSILGTQAPPAGPLIISTLVVFAVLVAGAFYFRRTERILADVL